MTRTQLLWLFVWIFLFFLILCIWNKLQQSKLDSPIHPQTQQIEAPTMSAQKEMYFKVIKVDEKATISGIVASQNNKDEIIDAYGKVFKEIDYENLLVEDDVKENDLLNFFINAADNFSEFNSGYITYDNGLLEIDGIAPYPIVQQSLEEELATVSDIKIDNKLLIAEIKTAPSPTTTKPTIDNNETSAAQTDINIQNNLDTLLKDKRVQFFYARDILTSDSQALVDDIITILKKNVKTKIIIAGHTDSDGTKENNKKLSQRRAESIKIYMISKDINESRLQAIGYGESKPLVKNDTLKNRRINRRVEFKVIGE